MLRGIRQASTTWLGRIVMGAVMTLLAAIFALWGINDIFHGFGRSYVAKIGDVEIAPDQFSQAYNERLQELSRQVGHPLSAQEANAVGLPAQVLGQMVAEAGLDQLARRMRLGIPDKEIADRVMHDPHFQTPTGQFDRALFQGFLQSIGYSEQRFFDEQRRTIPRRDLTAAVSGNITVPKTNLEAVNQYQNQERSIEFVTLGPQQAGDIPQPTPEELSKYFDERKILFRAPEYRKVVSVTVTPETLAKTIEVSDADVQKYYEQNEKTYSAPERRHVEQIVFPNIADAQAASERIKSGTTFAALAAERGLKPTDIDLGTVAKSGIIDPKVADAAFSLKQGEVSPPIEGRFGAVLVTVLQIEAANTKPLSVVAPFIRNDIAQERAKTQLRDLHDKIEDARAGGATLPEVAQKFNLSAATVEVDRSGRDPSGKLVTNLTDGPAVINAAFANDVGVDTYPIETGGGYVWYEVQGVTPARDRTLDEVKGEVEQRWRDDQIAKRLEGKATDLLDKAKSGNPFDALASGLGVKVEKATGLKRGTPPPGIPAKVLDAVFHTAKDAFGSSVGDKPTQWVVFRVTDVKTPALDPNSADGKKLEQILQNAMGNDLFSQYVGWFENQLGTKIDQAALAQAVGNSAPENP
jgi:peptidyl-prolyl cis-trans isomerase D